MYWLNFFIPKFIRKKIIAKKQRIEVQNRFTREKFIDLINKNIFTLEIGPFLNPMLLGENIEYFEVLNQADLLKRAKELDYTIVNIPEITYLSPLGDLSIVTKKYSQIISSHCIEHQPDFIKHLQNVEKLLNENGKYFLVIPDKRYCFDTLLPESSVTEILCAHFEKRKIHTFQKVMEHRAFITHNESIRHWQGDNGKLENVSDKIVAAKDEFEKAAGKYIDVHAWQFTPDSFIYIMDMLRELNYFSLKIKEIYPTEKDSLEFYVVLEK